MGVFRTVWIEKQHDSATGFYKFGVQFKTGMGDRLEEYVVGDEIEEFADVTKDCAGLASDEDAGLWRYYQVKIVDGVITDVIETGTEEMVPEDFD